MQGKLAVAVGFAGGYVLGSRAGRQRYEEIVSQARKLWGSQTVQSTAGVLQSQATDAVDKAKSNDLIGKAMGKAKSTLKRADSGTPTSTYESTGTGFDVAPEYSTTTVYETTTGLDTGTTDRPGTNGITP